MKNKKLAAFFFCLSACVYLAGCKAAPAGPEAEAAPSGTEAAAAADPGDSDKANEKAPEKKDEKKKKKDDWVSLNGDADDDWVSIADDGDGAEADGEAGENKNAGTKIVNNMRASELESIEKKLNGREYYGFLIGAFAEPAYIDWDEVFYDGAGFARYPVSDRVKAAYLHKTGFDEIMTDIVAVSGDDVRSFVRETTGCSYSDMKYPLEWAYLKDYDLYVCEHGDTNYRSVTVTGGMRDGDDYRIVYEAPDCIEYCVAFEDVNGKYRFLYNLPKWYVEDPTNGGDEDQTALTDGMVIPDSDMRKLSEEDLEGLDMGELRIARNEIYARHGRRFKDMELQTHFDGMDWYFPIDESETFDDGCLSDTEKYNADLISRYEKKFR
ncbi:MAG: YARHG domain-containing protein [Lachnospiraceae bacterium]|nr:YARHG domain-containing protein [Lachnospiraceae bacterium]